MRVSNTPGNRNTIHRTMRTRTKANYDSCIKIIMGAAIFLLMVMGCDNSTSPNQGLNKSHDIPVTMQSGDATNSTIEELPIYTADGFYFLPPMVKDSEYSGTFDAGLSPIVEICETPACENIHASYDMDGEGSERVRVDEEDEHYIVNWNANSSGAIAGQTYRVRVLVNDMVLGHADVAVVNTGREAVQVRSDGLIAVVANQTLPVKFRVEGGIVGSIDVDPAEATIEIGEIQQFTATLYDLHGELLNGPDVAWSSDDEDIADIGGDGLASGKSEGDAVINAASGPAIGSAQLTVTAGTESGFFLAENGITIRCPEAQPGDIGTVNGVEYEAVDRDLLIERRDGGADLSRVCTTPVTDMSFMFNDASDFNQDIGGWDTGNVTTMERLFSGAEVFNQDIGSWDTGNVINMFAMFARARAFNQDIRDWDTANAINMRYMFSSALVFNQNIGGWDTGKVTNMSHMFFGARAFNQPISGWGTGNVTNMNSMFNLAMAFNQPIGDWNTANVTNMRAMFYYAEAFNQDIGDWDTGNVTDMNSMFNLAIAFNQDIGGWDTGSVTTMFEMFRAAKAFNQPIGDWDTANVRSMSSMFRDATSFNRDLSGWCVTQITSKPSNFDTGATSWVLSRPNWGTCPE